MITESPYRHAGLFGYELGSVINGKWLPLLLVSPIYPTFKEATLVATKTLSVADSALSRKYLRNILQSRSCAFGTSIFGDGPGAA